MNIWNGIGNLGADPTIHRTPSGKVVANMSLAIDSFYYRTLPDGTKKKEETVNWVPVVVWGKDAELASRYLQKGSQIAVTGELRDRHWQKSDGTKMRSFEVHASSLKFLSRIKSNDSQS